MKIRDNYITAMLLLCAAAASFLYTVYENRNNMDDESAPVVVNVEVDKRFANDYRPAVWPEEGEVFDFVEPVNSTGSGLRNTVVYAEINGRRFQKLFIKCSDPQTALKPVDNIAVFVGNKTYYYPKSVIETWAGQETEEEVLFEIPLVPYAKSMIKPWINWYGDFNFVLKEVTAFLINPLSFLPALFFILLFISLFWTEIEAAFRFITKKHGKKAELILLLSLLVFAFLLRFNGFTRHSSWADELYSSTVAANPHLPWLNILRDPGNPPLFYLILRLWYEIFGWSEPAGRMLCVLLGVSGIATLYCFVKTMCGRKYAFLAAFLLAVNPSHIGYSQEIRAYILQMALVPLAAQAFFSVQRKGGLKNYAFYSFAGSALVNTHYYGVLLILFHYIYYVFVNRKQVLKKETVYFTAANIVIALSLLPFLVMTAFRQALMDGGFNTWIPPIGKKEFIVFVTLLLFCALFPLIKRRFERITKTHGRTSGLLGYAVYACSFIYIAAYLVSLKRNIFVWRYLSVCLPLVLSILPVMVFTMRYAKFDVAFRCLLLAAVVQFSGGFREFDVGRNDVYKEAQEYVSADAGAHSLRTAQLYHWVDDQPSYYGLAKIPPFTEAEDCEVVYINSLYKDEPGMSLLLSDAGLDRENILKIRTTNGRYIWKKYLAGDVGN
ncbi:MAG: glycosyltransferase family 39 protein [Treponema sp.]|jgi:hypothetical protein|nr:glycosyltransferase family 39 protein [Treponema sp.]